MAVTLLPSIQLLSASSTNAEPRGYVLFNILGLGVIGLGFALRRPRIKATPTLLVAMMILGFSLSCGGGGSGGQTTPPPPPSKSYTVTIQAPAGSSSNTLGQILLTVD